MSSRLKIISKPYCINILLSFENDEQIVVIMSTEFNCFALTIEKTFSLEINNVNKMD